MSTESIYKAIDEEIARLRNVRALLEANLSGHTNGNGKVAITAPDKKRKPLSAAARKRISRAQKLRWREQKAAAK